jgi:hypothetical protein
MLAKKRLTCAVCGESKKLLWFKRLDGNGYQDTCITCENRAKKAKAPVVVSQRQYRLGPREATINWSIYDRLPPDSVTCSCGRHYYTHTQYLANGSSSGKGMVYARKPCPGCGRTRGIQSVKSIPVLLNAIMVSALMDV